MILTQLDVVGAQKILELGRELHQESKYRDTPYNEERCWNVLNATQTDPRFFIAYDEDFTGFLILQASQHYFSGNLWVADLAFYVKPERRGLQIAKDLLLAGEAWAKSIAADELTIFHNTGIKTEKAPKFFNREGYNTAGYIFTKELK